jgi:hypothetical protein
MMKELNLEERYNKRAFRPRGREIGKWSSLGS